MGSKFSGSGVKKYYRSRIS